MDDFNERKEEYFKKLREDVDIISSLMQSEGNIKTKQILLNPETPQELEMAEATYKTISDLKNLLFDIMNGDVKPLDVNNCFVVDYFARLIKALVDGNQDEVNRCYLELSEMGVKEAAKLVYEMMVVFASNPEEVIDYIINKSGFNDADELQMLQFQLYLEKAKEITNSRKAMDINNVDVDDEKQVKEYIDFSDEFHRLCEEGRVQSNDKPLERGLFPGNIKITFN